MIPSIYETCKQKYKSNVVDNEVNHPSILQGADLELASCPDLLKVPGHLPQIPTTTLDVPQRTDKGAYKLGIFPTTQQVSAHDCSHQLIYLESRTESRA